MEATGIVLLSVLAVVLSGFLARASRLPLPLVQIALGVGIFYSDLTTAVLAPEVFFLLFLPPMLFLDGWRIPKDVLIREAPTVLRLALGLVVFTVLGMGWFIHWLVPAMPLAVAFALAAVISPTDPVAVSAIAARTPLPKRLLHILQGESLLNDASGLVCMRFAVAAALSGVFSLPAAVASFAWVAGGGVLIGAGLTLGLAWLVSKASQRLGEDGGAQILVTLLIPFGVYLVAEALGCSGILAAVAAGVTMSFADVWHWSAATRLRRTAVWDVVALATNGSIFVLLGEQLPPLLHQAPQIVTRTGHASPVWLLLYAATLVGALLVLRFAWVWSSLSAGNLLARRRGTDPREADWRTVSVMSLAGVRGAVTLAGVFTLPVGLANGQPFPARELAILLAAGVIVLSLLVATAGLPRLLKGLSPVPDTVRDCAEERTRVAAARAGIAAIEAACSGLRGRSADVRRQHEAAARIVAQYRRRIEQWSSPKPRGTRLEGDRIEIALRLVGLRAERDDILSHGRDHGLGDLALRKIVRELDHQEARYAG